MAVKNVELDLKRIAEKTKRKMVTFVHEFTQDMAETAIRRTPVQTGFLRGSWYASLGAPQGGFQGATDTTGANSVARVSVTVNGARVGDTIHVLNGANYASYVENGTYKMAPRLFVASTVNDATQIANRTAARIAKK